MNRYLTQRQQLVDCGKLLFANGWSPATSSNYSLRIAPDTLLITESGKHKGFLTVDDLMLINTKGNSLEANRKPSAETLLHTALYQQFADVNCVLHTHSVNATVFTLKQPELTQLHLQGYEMQKAFAGQTSHEDRLTIPIFKNSQNIKQLADEVHAQLALTPEVPGYLIAGHGLYTWGKNIEDCLRHVEAFEFLLQCELTALMLKRGL